MFLSYACLNSNDPPIPTNVPSAEAVPDKDREKAKHLFADFRSLNCLALRLCPALLTALCYR